MLHIRCIQFFLAQTKRSPCACRSLSPPLSLSLSLYASSFLFFLHWIWMLPIKWDQSKYGICSLEENASTMMTMVAATEAAAMVIETTLMSKLRLTQIFAKYARIHQYVLYSMCVPQSFTWVGCGGFRSVTATIVVVIVVAAAAKLMGKQC